MNILRHCIQWLSIHLQHRPLLYNIKHKSSYTYNIYSHHIQKYDNNELSYYNDEIR